MYSNTIIIDNLHWQYFREFNSPFRKKNLKFDFRPYSAFKFGGQNRRPNNENFRFRPKISASGIPLFPDKPIVYFNRRWHISTSPRTSKIFCTLFKLQWVLAMTKIWLMRFYGLLLLRTWNKNFANAICGWCDFF